MRPRSQERLPWKERPFPELIRLAWPIGVSTLSYSAMTLVDTLFVGRLGASALAGVSIGGIAAFTLLCFGFGGLRAVKVLTAQSIGAARESRDGGYLGAGLMLALALGLINLVLGWLLAGQLDRITSTAQSAEHGQIYLQLRVVAAPFVLVAIALREARYGAGDVKGPMVASVVANVINIVLTALFVGGFGWGVAGAAIASVIGALVDFAWLFATRAAGPLGLDRNGVRKIGAVWRLGAPMGAQMFLEIGAFAILTAIFASMSENDVAAHQIVLQVCHLSFLPALAIGEAASVMVGQAVGAGEDVLVPRVARQALLVAVGYTGLCAVLFASAGGPIADLFTVDPELRTLVVRLLYVAAAFQLFDGANIIARGVLRGAGDVRYPALVSIALAWCCTPPIALALGYSAGLGVLGGWLGFCFEIMLGALILWHRLAVGGWHDAAARQREEILAAPDSLAAPQPSASAESLAVEPLA